MKSLKLILMIIIFVAQPILALAKNLNQNNITLIFGNDSTKNNLSDIVLLSNKGFEVQRYENIR